MCSTVKAGITLWAYGWYLYDTDTWDMEQNKFVGQHNQAETFMKEH